MSKKINHWLAVCGNEVPYDIVLSLFYSNSESTILALVLSEFNSKDFL